MTSAVVDGDGMSHHLGEYGGGAGPSPQHPFLIGRIQLFDGLQKFFVYEGAFFQ
jgi:hypothetical protein